MVSPVTKPAASHLFSETIVFLGKGADYFSITLLTPKNGRTHSNNSLAVADELFECVWPFCGADT